MLIHPTLAADLAHQRRAELVRAAEEARRRRLATRPAGAWRALLTRGSRHRLGWWPRPARPISAARTRPFASSGSGAV
jgi:hypothetical protein